MEETDRNYRKWQFDLFVFIGISLLVAITFAYREGVSDGYDAGWADGQTSVIIEQFDDGLAPPAISPLPDMALEPSREYEEDPDTPTMPMGFEVIELEDGSGIELKLKGYYLDGHVVGLSMFAGCDIERENRNAMEDALAELDSDFVERISGSGSFFDVLLLPGAPDSEVSILASVLMSVAVDLGVCGFGADPAV